MKDDYAVGVGDKIRFTTELLKNIHKQPNHESQVVRVAKIVIQPDGTKHLWVDRIHDEESH